MNEVNVNKAVAESVSLKFSQTASMFKRVSKPITTIEKTNVSGVSGAVSTVQRLVSAGHQVSNALVRDGNNIHSVAQEFDAIDQYIGRGFEGLKVFSTTKRG